MALLLSLLIALASCHGLDAQTGIKPVTVRLPGLTGRRRLGSSTPTPQSRRFSVRYHSSTEKAKVLRSLEDAGYSVVAHYDRQQIVAVAHPAHHESDEVHSERLAAIQGVHFAERDHERYHSMAIRSTQEPHSSTQQLPDSSTQADHSTCSPDPTATCMWKDMAPNTASKVTNTIPYSIPMTQANDVSLKNHRSTSNNNVLICVIDPGFDSTSNDFDKSTLDVGDILGGANIFHVKVFNSGVSYASDLVNVLESCENQLNHLNELDVTKQYRMVVSISLYGQGPATTELMYFGLAGKRNDIMWVAAGNAQMSPPQPQPETQYPAGYKEVISVAAVDCNEQRAAFSLINDDVELSGPGVDVISDINTAAITTAVKSISFSPATDISFSSAVAVSGVLGTTTAGDIISLAGPLVDCGLALQDCTGVEGAVCLIQRGQNSWYTKLNACKAGGGVGALFFDSPPADPSQGCVLPPWEPVIVNGGVNYEIPGFQNLLPSVKLSYDQGAALLAQLKKSETVTVTIALEAIPLTTGMLSGTSMATPHVAGIAAHVWGAYPQCGSADLRAALRAGAKPVGSFEAGKNRNSEYGYGLVQAKNTLMELKKANCAKEKNGRKLRHL